MKIKLIYSFYDSPIGVITLGSDGSKLIGIWIEDQKYHGFDLYLNKEKDDSLLIFKKTKKWLDDYFKKIKSSFKIEDIRLIGTSFQLEVWKILLAIPYGEVTTYKDIAIRIAKNRNIKFMSSQAIGGAISRNPFAILIPCHRVVGIGNKLVGFTGGIDKKIELLKLEGNLNKFI